MEETDKSNLVEVLLVLMIDEIQEQHDVETEYFEQDQLVQEKRQPYGHSRRKCTIADLKGIVGGTGKCPRIHRGSRDHKTSEIHVHVRHRRRINCETRQYMARRSDISQRH